MTDPVRFTGGELIEMALRIEENGMRYYTDAGKAASNKKLKDLFKLLAEEEAHHIKVFTDLKKLIPGEGALAGYDPSQAEAGLYLAAVADTQVFTRPGEGAKLAKKVKDEREALSLAIQTEKDSLLFYYEFLKMVREKDRAVLDSLIEQEKTHLTKLTELRDELFPE